jgi:HEAT repeat protein
MDSEDELYHMGDAEAAAILMHRDTHFGGDFEAMLEYYETEGKGCYFDITDVLAVMESERLHGVNLASILLSGADAERVARAREKYEELSEIYESQRPDKARLMADLILSEEEDEERAVEAIVKLGESCTGSLLTLLQSDAFADPLFPGYGYAPSLAARCLGRIGDPTVIPYLFEAMGDENTALDEEAAVALRHVGQPAKEFLLNIVQGKRVTNDTERAAYLLTLFCPDPEILVAAQELLDRPEVAYHPTLKAYLQICCEE